MDEFYSTVVSCESCKKKYTYSVIIARGYADHEIIWCKHCKERIANIRNDFGSATLIKE